MTGENVVYPDNGITLNSKKKSEVLIPDTAWMNLENITVSKINQSQKTTYRKIPFI